MFFFEAFDVAEHEFGISPIMTGHEFVNRESIDKATMVAYLSQFYEYFRQESLERESGLWINSVAIFQSISFGF